MAKIIDITKGMTADVIYNKFQEIRTGDTVKFAANETFEINKTLEVKYSGVTIIGQSSTINFNINRIPDTNKKPDTAISVKFSQTNSGKIKEITADNFDIIGGVKVTKNYIELSSSDAAELKAGDYIHIYQNNDLDYINETGNQALLKYKEDPETKKQEVDLEDSFIVHSTRAMREVITEITRIEGTKIYLKETPPYNFTFKSDSSKASSPAVVEKYNLLSGIVIKDLTINTNIVDYKESLDTFKFENVLDMPVVDVNGNTSTDNDGNIKTHGYRSGDSAVHIEGVVGALVENVSVNRSASNGFEFRSTYKNTFKGLSIDGAYNKGGGGNGYGVMLNEAFGNTISINKSDNVRHSLLFSDRSAEHDNHINVKNANRDINFHGSPDSNNTVIVDTLNYSFKAGTQSWDVVSAGSIKVHPNSTIDANTVVFNNLTGGPRNDVVHADSDGASIDGNDGSDIIFAGAGNDTLDGGVDVIKSGQDNTEEPDSDMVSYLDTTSGVVVDLAITQAQNTGGSGWDTLKNFENMTGSNLSDTLRGNENDNVMSGKGGNDILEGRGGNDILSGTNGSDTASYESASGQVVVDLRITTDQNTVSAGMDTLNSIENLTGSQYNDRLYGNELNNTVNGGSGNDVLYGLGGNDLLHGGAGQDVLYGGAGDDVYAVDDQGDVVSEDSGNGYDVIVASASYSLRSSTAVEKIQLASSALGDGFNLSGNELDNELVGYKGKNTLDGQSGNDVMNGREGDDVYGVDDAGDRIIEVDGQGIDEVIATVSYVLNSGAYVEKMRFANAIQSNLDLTGNEFGNSINGNTGANKLNGAAGSDTLTGGSGSDTFVFSSTLGSSNVDRIVDFSTADDTILLARSVFTVLTAGTLSSGAFKDIGVAGATIDADDRILYNRNTGDLSYDADGNGSGTAVKFAVLDNKPILTNVDFVVA